MRKFLYFLLDETGRYLTVENGVVKAVAFPVPLRFSPDGWQDISLAWERDIRTVGITRNFSVPLGFVLEGAYILRKTFYDGNIERRVYLVIAKRYTEVDNAAQTFQHLYRKLYRGELDLSTFHDEELKVTASIAEGTIQKLYSTNRGTAYEFPLSEADVMVKMDGINLRQQHSFIIPQYRLKNYHFLPVTFINREGDGAGVATSSQNALEVPFNYDYANGIDYFLTTTQAIEGIRLKGQVIVSPINATSFTLALYRTSVGPVTIQTINNPGLYNRYTIDVDMVLDAVAGEKFYLVGTVNEGTVKLGVEYHETSLSLSVASRYRETVVRAFTPSRLFRLLVKAITGSEDNAHSDLLQQYDEYVITSGDGLRTIAGAKVKTSLNEFFEAFHTIAAAGLGIEGGKIRMEEKPFFLNPANPVPLGEIKNLAKDPAKDLLFNTIKAGYNPINTDDVNGRFAFNNSHIYKTAVTTVTKELTIVSPYAADPYAIELLRINLEGKTTTDNSADNQVFFLHTRKQSAVFNIDIGKVFERWVIGLEGATDVSLYPAGSTFTLKGSQYNDKTFTVIQSGFTSTGVYVAVSEPATAEVTAGVTVEYGTRTLYRDATMSITGVPDPDSIFNVMLAPMFVVDKHMPWINSCLAGLQGTMITFQTTEKNADLVVNGRAAKADIPVGTVRLFIALDLSFDTDVPVDLTETLETDPNRAFSFTTEGVTYTGFSRRLGISPNDEKEQSIKLLSAPDNNLSNFIK